MKVGLMVNSSWNVANFRVNLLKALQDEGHDVLVIAPFDGYESAYPFRTVNLPITSKSINPLVDLVTCWVIFKVLRKERPDLLLLYTAKPNVYANLIGRMLGIPTISNVAGLGSVFVRGGLLATFVKKLYQVALRHASCIFFQNRDDLREFVGQKLVAFGKSDVLPGSGVDTSRFAPAVKSQTTSDSPFVFLLPARMLWDKGVGEYIAVAKRLLAEGYHAEFRLLGFLDVDNSDAISRDEMADIASFPGIVYRGTSDKVEEELAEVDTVVLPTKYREGTPRALLEAAAMAIPVVTTRTPGCKDVVNDKESGLLCEPGDVESLYHCMKEMLDMSPDIRQRMGECARNKMIREYDENIVITKYINAVNRIRHKSESTL